MVSCWHLPWERAELGFVSQVLLPQAFSQLSLEPGCVRRAWSPHVLLRPELGHNTHNHPQRACQQAALQLQLSQLTPQLLLSAGLLWLHLWRTTSTHCGAHDRHSPRVSAAAKHKGNLV